MKGTTRFFLDVKTTARINDYFDDVHGVCKRTKFCTKMQCSFDDFVFYGTDNELGLPKNFPKMDIGQKVDVPCAQLSSTKTVEVNCGERGTLQPHPTVVNCTLDGTDDGEADEVETPWNRRMRKSCDECHRLGTASCQQVEGGSICTCKHNWSGFICWKSPNQCGLSQLHCGPNGTCISEVDRAFCLCGEGYGGDQCEISKSKLSFYAHNESSIISAVTGSALMMTASEVLLMILRAILLLHCPKSGKVSHWNLSERLRVHFHILLKGLFKDPQLLYQNMRSFVLSMASLLVLFFHHPAIFVISSFDCGMWFYMIITCYSLGIGFFALEALNLYEVSHMEQRNKWIGVMEQTVFGMPKMALRTFLTIVVFGGVVTAATAAHFSQVATSWTCLGNFGEETIGLWLPIVLINACAAIAANSFSYRSWFTLRNVPQFRQRMSIYLEERDLSEKYSIDKCYRNAVFTAFGPWLLCGMWLTLAISSDWVADSVPNK
ncbi:EGF-like domain protein [Ancylostoma caninum]|uniref:EGF-like domain protein n=1 Tax=Ancylostoma caninum TaxID=29170 RepID=A0A368H9Q7_ANCCA|nr:EGF-like domain protein [Ancylostoma caninum]